MMHIHPQIPTCPHKVESKLHGFQGPPQDISNLFFRRGRLYPSYAFPSSDKLIVQ